MTIQRSRYAAHPIPASNNGAMAASLTEEFRRLDQVLNDKTFPMPGMDNAYNAAAFPGATDEAKITRAIAQAAIDGVDVVWIPASMLPYDASLVTFNNAVRMTREGQGSWDEFDFLAYGALGDGTQDESASFTAVLAAIRGVTNPDSSAGGVLRLPGGRRYATSKPVTITGATGLKIVGARRTSGLGASRIRASFAYGPVICVAGNHTYPTATSLATGVGAAFAPTSGTHWLNLRDAATLDVHGLSALCVRCFFKPVGTTDGYIIASQGKHLFHDTLTRAFNIAIASGVFSATLKTSVTGQVTFPSVTVPVGGTTYYVALTYDGTTARLFLGTPGGTASIIASSAMTGTVVQGDAEDVTMAMGLENSPDAGAESNLAGGAGSLIDSLEVRNVATHTASFTAPTTKHVKDANTLMLINGDLQVGPMTRGETKNGDAWLVCREGGSAVSGSTVEFEDIELESATTKGATGIHFTGQSYRPVMNRLYITNCRNGIVAPIGNVYNWRAGELYIDSIARYGIALGAFSALASLDTAWIQGGLFPFYANNGIQLNNIFIQCQTESLWGIALLSGGSMNVVANKIHVNTEAGVSASWRAPILLQASGSVRLIASFLDSEFESANNQPSAIFDGAAAPTVNVASIDFTNCGFGLYGSAASLVTTTAVPTPPMRFNRPLWLSGFTPLASTAGAAIVSQLGKGLAVTFSATPTFDCSLRDEFEITLTANCAPTVTNITPGQTIKVTIKQDGTGGWTFTWPSNVKGGGTISGGASTVSQQVFTADLSSASAPNLYADAAMVVGM